MSQTHVKKVMKSVVLTGITKGLGKACYDLLNEEPYMQDQKIFLSRDILSRTSENGLTSYVSVDLSDSAFDAGQISINKNVKSIIFINNAGIIDPIVPAINMKILALKKSLQVNYIAPFEIARYLAKVANHLEVPFFILNITSGAANRPIGGWTAYCGGKVAVKMAFDVLALENENIEILHFDPGVMDTDMQLRIRNSLVSAMPDLKSFQNLKSNDVLKSPSLVAKEISKIILKYVP